MISTHSRAKAAGCARCNLLRLCYNFNSQPREGGWLFFVKMTSLDDISTHSRAKAAGQHWFGLVVIYSISTHSRAKAAGRRPPYVALVVQNFNSQPREGGWDSAAIPETQEGISTHSRAKAAG